MLQKIGLYLTGSRVNVIWITLLFALLPFVGLPTNWINILLIGLITLRSGAKEGLFVLGWAALPALALCFINQPELLLGFILLRAVVVWGLALVLRNTVSWVMTLQCAAIVGIVCVTITHIIVPSIGAWWLQQFAVFLNNAGGSLQLATTSPQQSQLLLEYMSQFATGILVVSFLVCDLFLLMLARGWQAVLVNPKGLSKELLQLRMGHIASLGFLLCSLMVSLAWPLALDIYPVVLLPFVLAGLSLIHAKLAQKKEIKFPVLIGLYIALVLFLPYMAISLALLAIVDSWYDFRSLRVSASQIV